VSGAARALVAGAAAASAASAGCNAECSGPGCAASYSTARLAWLGGVTEAPEQDVSDDAIGEWTGTAAQGTDWQVATISNSMLTGLPDADKVVATSARPTRSRLNPLATWVGEAGTGFGRELAVVSSATGFDLWVGAPDAQFGKGAALLFRRTTVDGTVHDQPQITLTGATPNDRVGTKVLTCGDVVGDDGAPEVLLGAPLFEQPDREVPWEGEVRELAGAVFLVRSYETDNRAGTFFPWEVGATWFSPDPGAGVGNAASCSTDFDGDGAIDVLLAAPYADAGRGRVYLLRGGALPAEGSLDGVPYLSGLAESDWFGSSLAVVQLEREPALVVGAPGAEGGTGRVLLLRRDDVAAAMTGPAGATLAEPRVTFSSPSGGESPGTHFGRDLYVGDLDGDGRDDLVVGTPDAQGPGKNDFDTGAIDLWFGRRTWRGQEDTPDARVLGSRPFQRIGRAVAIDDLDDDGVDELVVATRSAR
jgi:hypothetical protein